MLRAALPPQTAQDGVTRWRPLQSRSLQRRSVSRGRDGHIADRPPHRSVRAALPHTALTLDDDVEACFTSRTPRNPWDTDFPALCRARVEFRNVLPIPVVSQKALNHRLQAEIPPGSNGTGSPYRTGVRPALPAYSELNQIYVSPKTVKHPSSKPS